VKTSPIAKMLVAGKAAQEMRSAAISRMSAASLCSPPSFRVQEGNLSAT
jgi:hypothetical protein